MQRLINEIVERAKADRQRIVIDSLEGVEFLRKIGASLPPSMEDRVVDIDLRGTLT